MNLVEIKRAMAIATVSYTALVVISLKHGEAPWTAYLMKCAGIMAGWCFAAAQLEKVINDREMPDSVRHKMLSVDLLNQSETIQ